MIPKFVYHLIDTGKLTFFKEHFVIPLSKHNQEDVMFFLSSFATFKASLHLASHGGIIPNAPFS